MRGSSPRMTDWWRALNFINFINSAQPTLASLAMKRFYGSSRFLLALAAARPALCQAGFSAGERAC